VPTFVGYNQDIGAVLTCIGYIPDLGAVLACRGCNPDVGASVRDTEQIYVYSAALIRIKCKFMCYTKGLRTNLGLSASLPRIHSRIRCYSYE
jgi:hypothetical protein